MPARAANFSVETRVDTLHNGGDDSCCFRCRRPCSPRSHSSVLLSVPQPSSCAQSEYSQPQLKHQLPIMRVTNSADIRWRRTAARDISCSASTSDSLRSFAAVSAVRARDQRSHSANACEAASSSGAFLPTSACCHWKPRLVRVPTAITSQLIAVEVTWKHGKRQQH